MAANGVDGSVVIEIDADSSDFERQISSLGSTMQNAFGYLLADAISEINQQIVELGQDIWTAGVSFESAFAGVKKTVDETASISYDDLSQKIRDMAKELPSTVEEISAVAEAAGQLGIHTEDIEEFSRTMIDLGNSTNLVSEEAASALAKFANITQMSSDEYDELGAAIVDLGNNFATTERDIVNMSQRLAATASSAGISEQGILALSTALSSVGIEAEAGGTAMSTFIKKIQTAVETQSDSLEKYASIAGMTAEEFSKAFAEDGAGAINAFLIGLKKIDSEGGSALSVLNEMGIKETRLSNAVLALANSGDLLTRALESSNTAWAKGAALTEEAKKRYETTESKIQMLKNSINDLYISISQSANVGFDVGPFTDYIERLNDAVVNDGFNGLFVELGNVIADGMDMLGEKIAETLSESGTVVAESAATIVMGLATALLEQLPIITTSAIDVAVAFANGISNNLDMLVVVATDAVIKLADGLLSKLDIVIEAAIQLISALVEGLFKALPQLLQMAPTIIIKLAEALIKSLWRLREVPTDIGNAIAEGLANYDWIAGAESAIESLKDAFRNAVSGLGDDTGVNEQISAIKEYADMTCRELEQLIKSTDEQNAMYLAYLGMLQNDMYDEIPSWIKNAAAASNMTLADYLTSMNENLERRRDILSEALETARTEEDRLIAESGLSTMYGSDAAKRAEEEARAHFNAISEMSEGVSTDGGSSAVKLLADEEADNLRYLAEIAKESGEITEAEYYNRLETIANQLDKESELYKQYNMEIVKGRAALNADLADEAEKQRKAYEDNVSTIYKSAQDAARAEVSAVSDELDELVDTYKNKYDEIIRQRDDYKQQLMGDSIFTVTTETDKKTGEEITTYSIENLNKILKAKKDYAEQIAALENRGLADGLMSELESLDTETAAVFARQLNQMSDSEFAELNNAYKELDNTTTQLANERYARELESLQTEFTDKANALLSTVSDDLQNAGINSIQSYIDGMNMKKDDAFTELEAFTSDVVSRISDGISNGTVDISDNVESILRDSNVGNSMIDNILTAIDSRQDELQQAIQNILDTTDIDMQIKADMLNGAAISSSKGYQAAEVIYVSQAAQNSPADFSDSRSSSKDITINANLKLTDQGGRVIADVVNEENKRIEIEVNE